MILDHTFYGKARPLYGYSALSNTYDDIGVEEHITGAFKIMGVMYDEDKGEGTIICNGELPCKDWLIVMEDYGDNLKPIEE